jgi:hypothetical protein
MFAIVVGFYLSIWWIVGFAGFLFWHTNEYDEFPEGFSWLVACFYGIFVWIDGYEFHNKFFPENKISLINILRKG